MPSQKKSTAVGRMIARAEQAIEDGNPGEAARILAGATDRQAAAPSTRASFAKVARAARLGAVSSRAMLVSDLDAATLELWGLAAGTPVSVLQEAARRVAMFREDMRLYTVVETKRLGVVGG
jgi:hypothetical protein